MKIRYNVTGTRRKELAAAIGQILGDNPEYMGMPSAAYRIGGAVLDKEGTLEMETVPGGMVEQLEAQGFTGEEEGGEELGLSISLPLEGFTEESLENLRRLIGSKATLIRKALNTDRLDVEVEEEKVTFPWWDTLPEGVEAQAYMAFISAISKMAKQAKRVTGTDHPVESEKYAFRTFLMRLGFVGADHKELRKTLLKNLSGSSGFPNTEAAHAFYEKQKAKRESAE